MQAINLSEKNKVILWMPQSTASRLATLIFNNFDFCSYNIRKGGVLLGNTIEHNHYIGLPINHKDYKLIMTCRNPYTQVTAGFDGVDSQEKLVRSLEEKYQSVYHMNFINHLKYKTPDYFLRVENLLDDYLKIPFIRESEFYKSGEMLKLMSDNPFKNKIYRNRPVIDKKLADLIYYNNSYYFELLGYDKDSWKQ